MNQDQILEAIVKVKGKCSQIAGPVFTCSQCPLGTPSDSCKIVDDVTDEGSIAVIYKKRMELAQSLQKLKYLEGL